MAQLRMISGPVLWLGLSLSGAYAQTAAVRTWVSSSGADSGACSFASPCKTLQYALSATPAGGSINIKDSGVYSQLNINKSVTIVAPEGVVASVGVPSGVVGIEVNAGASDNVTIKDLTVEGLPDNSASSSQAGIKYDQAGNLTIVGCIVSGTNAGFELAPGAYNATIIGSTFINN